MFKSNSEQPIEVVSIHDMTGRKVPGVARILGRKKRE